MMKVSVYSSAVPHSIHAFILSDEFNKLLDSKTELETTLEDKQKKHIDNIKQV